MSKGVNGVPKHQGSGRPRFYKAVTVAVFIPSPLVGQGRGDSTPSTGGGGYRILLDGKPIRTPAKNELLLPSRALADAVAAEWEAQTERIDPTTMPLTKFANSAIDGVMGREAEVRADIVKYAGNDLVCYRAEGPPELVRRQAEAWDPVLVWIREVLGAPFHVTQGIMPAAQSVPATANVAHAIEAYGAFDLAALHVVTTLMGSALLALAHARGHLSAEDAWVAAHIDEDWQIHQWGEDAEAKARREQRWQEMRAASRLIELLR